MRRLCTRAVGDEGVNIHIASGIVACNVSTYRGKNEPNI